MIVVLFAALALVSFSNRTPLHPGALSFLTRSEIENVECREPNANAGSVLEAARPSRTAGMGITGHFQCYRPVFRADERNPYIDRALEAEFAHAKLAAQAVSQRIADDSTVGVQVEGEIEDLLKQNIAMIYRSELAAVLGSKRVLRRPADDSPVLNVRVFRVDVPELMSKTRLKTVNRQGEIRWLDI